MEMEYEIVLYDHFHVKAEIYPHGGGLGIFVVFGNLWKEDVTPNIEIWLPFTGFVEYYEPREGGVATRVIVGPLYHFSNLRYNSENKQWEQINGFHGLITPGKFLGVQFFSKISLEHAERMKEIAEKEGVVTLVINLQFSALYNQGKLGQKTHNYALSFQFQLSKKTLEEWMAQWSGIYAYYAGLPKSVPQEVLHDYIEALKAYNVGAYRAAVVMARRALQQAVEDKGASKKRRLHEQINELFEKGLLDKATKSLADGVRHFGNYGAHPQEDLLSQVTKDDARLTIEILKRILAKLYGSP
ncbi:DUF4145 domain-containing protein [Thermococcus sp. LS1]|uniref:DUF4145 domain-containing protein n=1 Tax=Thermococcus sp. LS1 TaxID=1638259 RepID=UPI001439D729|nr:DUF4145 domain-containing protein [Thermococcus sp. LS1]NJD99512.1 DUF4145 domain-containing protein [Thermococcus sp. LS1]